MKRLLSLSIVTLVGGFLATGCNVTPPAATINGTSISVSSFNDQLRSFDATQVGPCLLAAETGQSTPLQTEGTGGPGTYDMAFADSILENSVGNELASQLAASKGLHVSGSDLRTAQQNFVSTLDGEISAAAQQASQTGTASPCMSSNGQSWTGAQVIGALPTPIRNALISNNAIDQKLLADGAALSDAAISTYYSANEANFSVDCVSVIVADTQDHANQYGALIKAGTPFGDVAKAHSLDTQTAANGGALGCSYTQAQVEQALQLQSVPVGQPTEPIQDMSTGAWGIFEVTSQTVAPLSKVKSTVVQQLLQTATNGNRIAKEIEAFARTSTVSIDPRYGVWKVQGVVSPVAPPARYLLAAASGQVQTPLAVRSPSSGSRSSVPSTPSGAN